MLTITPVILSGISTGRFWLKSSAEISKQFSHLASKLNLYLCAFILGFKNIKHGSISAVHWPANTGTADPIDRGNKNAFIVKGSFYVPMGVIHSLANPLKEDIELLEIHSDSYSSEDDNVRLDDLL